MLGPLYIALDKYGRPDPKGLAKRVRFVPPWVIRGISRAKLAKVLRYVWKNSPVQREAWEKAGVKYRELGSPEVMKRIPFLDKERLMEEPKAFWCVPEDELIHVITTSGTKGRSKQIYLTEDDLRRQTKMIGTSLRRLPGASRVMAIFRLTDPTWSSGAVVRRGIEEGGFFGLLAGTDTSPADLIKLIKKYRIDVLTSSASSIHRLTMEAKGVDLKALGVKYIYLSAQAWAEELRAMLEEAWGAKILDAYATNECGCGIASECPEQNGLHVSQVDFWMEVVNSQTGQAAPDGEEGELVITTLSRRGMPLVRYRIGDLTRILPGEGRCKCGLPVRRIARVKGRVDDMLILGTGTNVYPDEFDRSVLSVPGVTDFQMVVERDDYMDVLNMTLETEMTGEPLKEAVMEAMRQIKFVRLGIEQSKTIRLGRVENVARGTLTKDRPKSRRIIDKRVY